MAPRGRTTGVVAGLCALLLAGNARAADPSPCDLRFPSDSTVRFTCLTLRRGDSFEKLFGDRWQDVARFNRMDRRHARAGTRVRVPLALDSIACFTPLPAAIDTAGLESLFVLVDLGEQFLGVYERGKLVFSAPLTSGRPGTPTPTGDFRITVADPDHRSSLYTIEGSDEPYPMHWGLLFHVSSDGEGYWIHGRDLPGFPGSHGCVGLSDEAMQVRCYGWPETPVLADAQGLYERIVGAPADSTRHARFAPGVQLRVIGQTPVPVTGKGRDAAVTPRLSPEHGRVTRWQ